MKYITALENDVTVNYGNKVYRIQKDRNYRHIVVFEEGVRKKITVKTIENDCVFNYIFDGGFNNFPCPAMDYWIYRHRLRNKISTKDYQIKFSVIKKVLILFMFLYPLFTEGQSKNEILFYTSQFISGCADGTNQAIEHHFLYQGRRFWDYKTSWKNKYKNFPNDKRAAYFGSKSFLVWTTDGYHLTRFIDRSFQLGSIYFALGEKYTVKKAIKTVIIGALVNRAGFYTFYEVVFPYNQNRL